jgi:arylsulfatase A-like enzyme
MNRRVFLTGLAGASIARTAPEHPNILFIFSDDHHWQCLGAAGNPQIHTPNLDRLAARGVNFTNGTITTPQCAPSRGVMLSGLETYQSGLLSNGERSFRAERVPTVVEQLRTAGYDTILVGKWHVIPKPGEVGFAKAPLWLPGGSSQYRNPPQISRGLDGKPGPVEGHITDLWADTACEYLSGARQPFLMWLAFNAPHTPWYAADKYRARYEGKRDLAPPSHPPGGKEFDWISYYSVITHLDEAIGRVIERLEQSKLWENTLIFFVGDNGYMCGTKGLSGKVVPWEESIRVPFFASGGLVNRAVKLDMPAASVDLPATWLDYAGVKPAYKLAGRSLKSVLTSGKPDRDEAFVTWADGRPGALAGGRQHNPYRLVRTRTHKLIRWESGKEELYDHSADPGETRNLIGIAAQRKMAEDLRSRLTARMKATGDPALKWPS